MSDNAFWTTMAVLFFSIVASIGGCSSVQNYQDNSAMVEMVIKGADPIDAKCAIKGNTSETVCAIRAATKNK